MPSPRATLSLSTQSSSTLTYGGVDLIDPLVPVYVFFSIIVPTPRGLCTGLYFQFKLWSLRSSSRYHSFSLGSSCGDHLRQLYWFHESVSGASSISTWHGVQSARAFGGYSLLTLVFLLMGHSLCTSSIYSLGGASCIPMGRVKCASLSLKTLLWGHLVAWIQKMIYLGCTFAIGFGWRPCTLFFQCQWGGVGSQLSLSIGRSYVSPSGRTCGGFPNKEEDISGGGACYKGFGWRPLALLLSMGVNFGLCCHCPLAAPPFRCLGVLVGGFSFYSASWGVFILLLSFFVALWGVVHSPPLQLGFGETWNLHLNRSFFFASSAIPPSVTHEVQDVLSLAVTPLTVGWSLHMPSWFQWARCRGWCCISPLPPAPSGSRPTASSAPTPYVSEDLVHVAAPFLALVGPAPLLVHWFTLPPIKSRSDYLQTRDLIL